MPPLSIVFLGLSITSSWGNGHATNYRALIKALTRRGHRCLFLERDKPWYADNRDLPNPPFGRTELYGGIDELRDRFGADVRDADAVIVGSYVPDGVEVGRWATSVAQRGRGGVTAFYDIDTPVTLAKLARGDFEYLAPDLIPLYDLYLSFTGGPTLARLERELGSPAARPFYCLVDPDLYAPDPDAVPGIDLGYLGTYSDDRQPAVDRLLVEPARRLPGRSFVVAGPQYPESIRWPENVRRIDHLPPAGHRAFYNAQRFTLNVTRADMVRAGWSPSVRLFEAAAGATPVISDLWPGFEDFFEPGREVLFARDAAEAVRAITETPEDERLAIGERARRRVLAEHTADARAEQLEACIAEARDRRTRRGSRGRARTFNPSTVP